MEYKTAKDPDSLLKIFSEHERVIAQLYQAYASRFDGCAAFWDSLAREELQHAACLNKLRTLLQANSEIVIVERFSVDAIQFSINYIHTLIERAYQPNFILVNALSLATKLEEALLEKNFFDVLSGDSQEVQETLEFLEKETERHSRTLREGLRDYNNLSG